MIDDDNMIDVEFAALDAPRDDGERVIVNHVIADLDATAKFAQVLAQVTRALINRRRDGRV